MNVNVNLMEKNVSQIKSGITINVAVIVKDMIYVKFHFENGKYLKSIMNKIICVQIIE